MTRPSTIKEAEAVSCGWLSPAGTWTYCRWHEHDQVGQVLATPLGWLPYARHCEEREDRWLSAPDWLVVRGWTLCHGLDDEHPFVAPRRLTAEQRNALSRAGFTLETA